MTLEKRGNEFSPETPLRLPEVFSTVPQREQEKLTRQITDYQNIAAVHTGIVQEQKVLLELAYEPVRTVQEEIQKREQVQKEEEERLAGSLKNSDIKRRIRVKLASSTFRIPWYAKPVALVARRLAREEDPGLSLVSQDVQILQNELTQKQKEYEEKRLAVEIEFAPQVEQSQKALSAAERRLLETGDTLAAQDIETGRRYVALFPFRLDRVAQIRSREIAGTEDTLSEFYNFYLQYTNPTTRQFEQFGKRFSWFQERRSPTLSEYKQLPKEIQDIWTNAIRRTVLRDLQSN